MRRAPAWAGTAVGEAPAAMNHSIPVWLWLRCASPGRRAAAAANPLPLVVSMTRRWERVFLLWWVIVLGSTFALMWMTPSSFWYAIPLLVSAGVIGYGLLGAARPSEEVAEEFRYLWQDADMDARWPRRYRQAMWQLELAAELLGDDCRARLLASALEDQTPIAQAITPPSRRL